ncbi:hypothetical protein [Corynebacterium timonense]|uniref:Uncharacterized protein n=1 Tax=Corynebacterium timonense TaxID=441500 RepID=A0A1H1VJX7_9CORY|nr:hypothetical protein [Corynebacterium timonense]SDS85187.1 hypothetical protein SAMN04488539_2531 [Corynebacterium timonense]
MRLIHCACASRLHIDAARNVPLPALPSRSDLRFLDDAARELLPVDPTPSLAEIAASPSVEHLGAPTFAPQEPAERLRVVVSGSDAALAAVLSRMMRADYLWAEVAYIPTDPASAGAAVWGVAALSEADRLAAAIEAPVTPSPCIRTDRSEVVAGSATLTHHDPAREFVGEIVVDSQVLLFREDPGFSARFSGDFGAKLVPMNDQPGLAASRLTTPTNATGPAGRRSPEQLEALSRLPLGAFFTRRARVAPGRVDASSVLTGRAVQAGGLDICVTVDGVARPRPVDRVTFYRHLRDLQSVKLPA